jgi:type II secretory pathway component PulF
MPTYVYKAKDGPQRTVQGEVEAANRAEALARIDAMGYSPVSVAESETAASRRRLLFPGRVGPRDITVFTRQLGSLIRSGVPILRGLSTIAQQTENRRLRRVVEDLEATIRDGNMLSDALSRHPRLFPPLFVNMVHSGESGGALDTVLFRLADAREKDDEIRRRVQAAAAYPALVTVVGAVTVFVLLSFFMPRVVALFRDYQDLPLPTRILIGASEFFSRNWYWILLVGVLVAAVARRLAALEKGRTVVDAVKLRLPFVGRFVRESDIARFARTLALLLESGVSIDRALSLSADTLRNAVLREEVLRVREKTVRHGVSFSEGLRQCRQFPPFVANMSAVGEEGGRLEEALGEVASFYEKEVEQRSRVATSLVEPALILTVGALVGFIVFAMLLPIFKIGGML